MGRGFSGVWTVTYSIVSTQDYGDTNQAYLYVNGEQMQESYYGTYYDGSEGGVSSLGSRTLYMRLESGDTITLRSAKVGHGLYHITHCLELAQFDYRP